MLSFPRFPIGVEGWPVDKLGVNGVFVMTTCNYRPPVKRSVTIAGHETALTLEPVFWEALRAAAETRSLPLNALIARIDAERITAPNPPNLASAIRQWLFTRAVASGEPMS